VGVSKQEWKDYQSNTWLGTDRKSGLDDLMQAFDGIFKAIDGGNATEFLAYTESNGKLSAAALKAYNAGDKALTGIKALRLEGNQRRFADKNAITTSDAAIASVEQYCVALEVFGQGLIRGVSIEHDSVASDQAAMPKIKECDLVDRLETERDRIQGCNDEANTKVAALAAIDKIGIV
jgi:hypothetical protein